MTDLRFQPGSIEQLRIDELRPYERNPRTHSDDQVAKLAASLVEFGWTMPILVNDELEVIAGHGRILAARRLGLDAVPVIRLAHLTPEQVRAYRIADNKLALDAGWDEELLAAEFHELNGAGYDLGLTGFSAEELDELLAPIGDGSDLVGDPEKVPEPPAHPVSRPGDLWLLGAHRLLCGDSTQRRRRDAADAWRARHPVRHRPAVSGRLRRHQSSRQDQARGERKEQDPMGGWTATGSLTEWSCSPNQPLWRRPWKLQLTNSKHLPPSGPILARSSSRWSSAERAG